MSEVFTGIPVAGFIGFKNGKHVRGIDSVKNPKSKDFRITYLNGRVIIYNLDLN